MKLLVLISLFVLVWCFWEEQSDKRGLILHDTKDFSLFVPKTWTQVDENDITVPDGAVLSLALASSQERQGYLNNLVIISSPATQENTTDIMNSSHFVNQKRNNFTLLSEHRTNFLDDLPADILIFRGRYNPDNPEITYIQTVKNCDDTKYFMTISVAEKLEDYERYEYVLRTFRCG